MYRRSSVYVFVFSALPSLCAGLTVGNMIYNHGSVTLPSTTVAANQFKDTSMSNPASGSNVSPGPSGGSGCTNGAGTTTENRLGTSPNGDTIAWACYMISSGSPTSTTAKGINAMDGNSAITTVQITSGYTSAVMRAAVPDGAGAFYVRGLLL